MTISLVVDDISPHTIQEVSKGNGLRDRIQANPVSRDNTANARLLRQLLDLTYSLNIPMWEVLDRQLKVYDLIRVENKDADSFMQRKISYMVLIAEYNQLKYSKNLL